MISKLKGLHLSLANKAKVLKEHSFDVYKMVTLIARLAEMGAQIVIMNVDVMEELNFTQTSRTQSVPLLWHMSL